MVLTNEDKPRYWGYQYSSPHFLSWQEDPCSPLYSSIIHSLVLAHFVKKVYVPNVTLFPYLVHFFWPQSCWLWSNVLHYIGNRVTFVTHTLFVRKSPWISQPGLGVSSHFVEDWVCVCVCIRECMWTFPGWGLTSCVTVAVKALIIRQEILKVLEPGFWSISILIYFWLYFVIDWYTACMNSSYFWNTYCALETHM